VLLVPTRSSMTMSVWIFSRPIVVLVPPLDLFPRQLARIDRCSVIEQPPDQSLAKPCRRGRFECAIAKLLKDELPF